MQLPWGIEVAPILQYGSARPYNTSTGKSNVLGFGSGPATAHAIVQNGSNDLLWENTQSTTALRNCYLAGACHQVGFDYLRGQEFFNLDTRLTKTVKLGEQANFKFIFQMFDVTNRANYGGNYDGNVHDATFMQPLGYATCGGGSCNRNIPIAFRGEWGVQFTF